METSRPIDGSDVGKMSIWSGTRADRQEKVHLLTIGKEEVTSHFQKQIDHRAEISDINFQLDRPCKKRMFTELCKTL